MTVQPLRIEVEKGVATLVMNRPASGNTIDLSLARALVVASIRCDQDDSIRCVVLSGEGRIFCAGGDLAAMHGAGAGRASYLSELAGTLNMALSRLMRMAKPLVTLVNGPAAGAGLSLAVCGDIVIAARSAQFQPAYSAVGLSPDGGLSWLLPRLIGLRRAQELLLRNRRLSALEAAELGLVTMVVDDACLADEGAAVANELAAGPTHALGSARRLLLESFDSAFETQLEREARAIAEAATTADCEEGIAAFLEKRSPNFRLRAD